MKYLIILLVLSCALLVACEDSADPTAGIEPIVTTLQPLLTKLRILVGGIFGLYLILILVRVYYERQKVQLLKDIRYDLDHLNQHQGISHSQQKKTLLKKILDLFRRVFRRK